MVVRNHHDAGFGDVVSGASVLFGIKADDGMTPESRHALVDDGPPDAAIAANACITAG